MHRNATQAIVQLLAIVQIFMFVGVASAETKVACVGDSITEMPGWCMDLGKELGASFPVWFVLAIAGAGCNDSRSSPITGATSARGAGATSASAGAGVPTAASVGSAAAKRRRGERATERNCGGLRGYARERRQDR
jgi:hypothetical protein